MDIFKNIFFRTIRDVIFLRIFFQEHQERGFFMILEFICLLNVIKLLFNSNSMVFFVILKQGWGVFEPSHFKIDLVWKLRQKKTDITTYHNEETPTLWLYKYCPVFVSVAASVSVFCGNLKCYK